MVRTITIRDVVYDKLASVKRSDESFSELLDRLVEGSDSMGILRSLRGSVELRDGGEILKEIDDMRRERRT